MSVCQGITAREAELSEAAGFGETGASIAVAKVADTASDSAEADVAAGGDDGCWGAQGRGTGGEASTDEGRHGEGGRHPAAAQAAATAPTPAVQDASAPAASTLCGQQHGPDQSRGDDGHASGSSCCPGREGGRPSPRVWPAFFRTAARCNGWPCLAPNS